MKGKTVSILALLISLISCKTNNELKGCIDDSKFQSIELSISILDSKISEIENQSNINKAYADFAKHWYDNPRDFNKYFDSEFTNELKTEFTKTNMLSEFYDSKNNNQVNFDNKYIYCLSKIESDKIQSYVKYLKETGMYLNVPYLMDGFMKFQSLDKKSTLIMVLKIDFILKIINST